MIDAVALDVTPVSGPSFFQEYHDKGWTPLSDRGTTQHSDATKVVSESVVLIAGSGNRTPTVAELRRGVHVAETNHDSAVVADATSAAKDVRSVLLAKKYAGKSSREDTARLDILTERIRLLSPRVTDADVTMLSSIVDQAEAMSEKLSDIRSRYGIK